MTLHISFLEPLIPPFAEFKISETDFLRQLLRLFHYFSPLCSRIRINESSQQIFKLRSSWFSATFTQFFFPGLHPSIEIFKVNFELPCFGSCKVIQRALVWILLFLNFYFMNYFSLELQGVFFILAAFPSADHLFDLFMLDLHNDLFLHFYLFGLIFTLLNLSLFFFLYQRLLKILFQKMHAEIFSQSHNVGFL